MSDLQPDPGETHNLYGDPQYADVQAQLWKRLAELQRQIGNMDVATST